MGFVRNIAVVVLAVVCLGGCGKKRSDSREGNWLVVATYNNSTRSMEGVREEDSFIVRFVTGDTANFINLSAGIVTPAPYSVSGNIISFQVGTVTALTYRIDSETSTEWVVTSIVRGIETPLVLQRVTDSELAILASRYRFSTN